MYSFRESKGLEVHAPQVGNPLSRQTRHLATNSSHLRAISPLLEVFVFVTPPASLVVKWAYPSLSYLRSKNYSLLVQKRHLAVVRKCGRQSFSWPRCDCYIQALLPCSKWFHGQFTSIQLDAFSAHTLK